MKKGVYDVLNLWNISYRIRMENKKVRNICIALLFIMLFIYLVICVNSIMNHNKIGAFAYKFYIMSSDSSESNANSGDLIIAKSVKPEDIKENDSIIYKRNDSMVVKKVIGTDNENGNTNIYIENDNVILNESIQNAQIMGKVVHTIKGFGNVALVIQSPLGTINILLIALCVFIIIKKISKNSQVKDADINHDEANEKVNDEN